MADAFDVGDEVAELALEVVGDVRDGDPGRLHARLRALRRRHPLLVEQLVVALAAMVPDDLAPSELLGWTDTLMPPGRRRRVERADYDARRYRKRLRVVPPDRGGQQEEDAG